MRFLYQFPLSHFCEKARWMLDHKELDYIAENLTPGLHRFKIHYHTGQNHLPVLKDGQQWVADSTRIALYLDAHYPEHTLIRKEDELRSKILAIDDLTQELGIHVRRWLFHFLLQQEHSPALDIIIGERGVMRDFEKVSLPALKLAIRTFHDINEQTVELSKQRIDDIIAELNQILIQNGGRYLVGQRLTLADIAVCSMTAPLLLIEGTPWEISHVSEVSQEILEFKSYIMQLPLGQYVARIYETERNARVDWRGM